MRGVMRAAGRGVTMGWRIALETRRGGGGRVRGAAEVRGDGLAASVGDAAGRGAGPWRGGELGYRRSGREAVSSCLREIHLEPAIIDYQAVNSRKGCR